MRRVVNIYLVAGAWTHEEMFRPLAEALKYRFEQGGLVAITRVVLPYEDGNRFAQLREARRDVRLYPEQAAHSAGGVRVRRLVRTLGARDPLLLIGCGSGGAAAYHAAELLEAEGCEVRFVVQVGSPKVPIGHGFRERVGYIAKKGGLLESDPHVWQGSWSHAKYRFASHRYPGLLYNAREKGRRYYAPGQVAMLDVEGRVPDYFSPVAGRGSVSNLAQTMNTIWEWFGAAKR
ncbi:hypothetical protein IDH44_25130 [Paenibacillus sp. IB182496]|uniref:Uncharacterized protein n=1 Tax=Paenibacillus sabuli TaxID=2772509 RepID=A0A927BZR1_9BACL|nr:hypothetical protein [Paenibacillus sabuli]MBD2848479.1 hypothetical protein [Paenibacillus sabuli]